MTESSPTYVPWKSVWRFTKEIFIQVGLTPEEAEIEADVLVWANLRGVDSHGVRAVPRYVRGAQAGHIKLKAEVQLVKETAAVLFIDADHAFGPVATVHAMEQVIHKARTAGIAWALLRDITHQGAIGYYALMAAKQEMVGMAWVCNPPNMAPFGAQAGGVHNSPIAIAAPATKHPPLVLDMATSIAAFGKVAVAADKGEPIPATWALDRDGNPTTDPRQAAVLNPFGGYKGSGLALMFECLSSLMVGNPLLLPRLMGLDKQPVPGTQNGVLAAMHIGAFTDVEAYKENIDGLIDAIKALPKAPGVDEIFVPGEPEERVREQRLREGIPLPAPVVASLLEIAAELQVVPPPELETASQTG
jgi:ureidoglycolate dehydrogenase (NAD+)